MSPSPTPLFPPFFCAAVDLVARVVFTAVGRTLCWTVTGRRIAFSMWKLFCGRATGGPGATVCYASKKRWYCIWSQNVGWKILWTMIWGMIYRSHKSIKIWQHFWQNLSRQFDAPLILPIPFFQIQEPGATMLDVRSPQEFAQGHLPGAKNLPLFPGRD